MAAAGVQDCRLGCRGHGSYAPQARRGRRRGAPRAVSADPCRHVRDLLGPPRQTRRRVLAPVPIAEWLSSPTTSCSTCSGGFAEPAIARCATSSLPTTGGWRYRRPVGSNGPVERLPILPRLL